MIWLRNSTSYCSCWLWVVVLIIISVECWRLCLKKYGISHCPFRDGSRFRGRGKIGFNSHSPDVAKKTNSTSYTLPALRKKTVNPVRNLKKISLNPAFRQCHVGADRTQLNVSPDAYPPRQPSICNPVTLPLINKNCYSRISTKTAKEEINLSKLR